MEQVTELFLLRGAMEVMRRIKSLFKN